VIAAKRVHKSYDLPIGTAKITFTLMGYCRVTPGNWKVPQAFRDAPSHQLWEEAAMYRRSLLGILLLVWSSASFAIDPLTLILLRVLRDQAVTSSAESMYEESQREDSKPRVAVMPPPPYAIEDQKLRALIDEGFVYLTAAQRDEVYAGVRRGLADPKNAHLQPLIIQELAFKASAMRQAHERLNNLSYSQKQAIAGQALEEYTGMSGAERQQMIKVLQSGAAPIPRDLNDMMLAEFSRAPAAVSSTH